MLNNVKCYLNCFYFYLDTYRIDKRLLPADLLLLAKNSTILKPKEKLPPLGQSVDKLLQIVLTKGDQQLKTHLLRILISLEENQKHYQYIL